MVIGIRDACKLLGISVIACCAVFVCTLFMNFHLDLVNMEEQIVSEPSVRLYRAMLSSGKVTVAVSGGCLLLTSAVTLGFYIRQYLDAHGKELGILKALGYSRLKLAFCFRRFGGSVLVGCIAGFVFAFLLMPSFYEVQNAEQLFPEIAVHFHPILALGMLFLPPLFFSGLSIGYAYLLLGRPTLALLREERKEHKAGREKSTEQALPFLRLLRRQTLRSGKILVFFLAFSAFCFSAMTQMSFGMRNLTSRMMEVMVLVIGVILACTTLFLAVSTVIRSNAKTIAMMRVFGYSYRDCGDAILGGYRPVSYVGFAVGSVYQYGLLKGVVTIVFKEVESVPSYAFNWKAFAASLVAFAVLYELAMHVCTNRIRSLSLKSVMSE